MDQADDDRFLRVDCDYEAEGLWDKRGRMVSADSVPVDQALRDRIKAWNAWYSDEAMPWRPDDRYNWELHRLNAEDIARCLKRSLGDWTIVALDLVVLPDLSLGPRLPFPGEHLIRSRD